MSDNDSGNPVLDPAGANLHGLQERITTDDWDDVEAVILKKYAEADRDHLIAAHVISPNGGFIAELEQLGAGQTTVDDATLQAQPTKEFEDRLAALEAVCEKQAKLIGTLNKRAHLQAKNVSEMREEYQESVASLIGKSNRHEARIRKMEAAQDETKANFQETKIVDRKRAKQIQRLFDSIQESLPAKESRQKPSNALSPSSKLPPKKSSATNLPQAETTVKDANPKAPPPRPRGLLSKLPQVKLPRKRPATTNTEERPTKKNKPAALGAEEKTSDN
ncbi:hypothetical protein EDB81DRAFT_941592 [Dactylonectria macrodidyma]|uniref:Uncharacterized protein n=1 Tax=Dactylonectria macrodidyma TaxID=307937 RepID=A0A9P9FPJ8_9HYPO|nr:hypothetical protein EDB81DRAFT_941592 [Dactylonectria macrodidyma]